MRPASGRRLEKLLRIIRRKDMRIAKLKRDLRQYPMKQSRKGPRKAVITITESGRGMVTVNVEFSPSVGEAGACADLGMAGFSAVVDAVNKAGKDAPTETGATR